MQSTVAGASMGPKSGEEVRWKSGGAGSYNVLEVGGSVVGVGESGFEFVV